ncbi:MAG TPA: hypothetical protein VFH69_03710, partial [Gemmatimonadota bacterium]|nr:hypothetical protein [Gemmatimonadota bacterium]
AGFRVPDFAVAFFRAGTFLPTDFLGADFFAAFFRATVLARAFFFALPPGLAEGRGPDLRFAPVRLEAFFPAAFFRGFPEAFFFRAMYDSRGERGKNGRL